MLRTVPPHLNLERSRALSSPGIAELRGALHRLPTLRDGTGIGELHAEDRFELVQHGEADDLGH